VRFKLFAST